MNSNIILSALLVLIFAASFRFGEKLTPRTIAAAGVLSALSAFGRVAFSQIPSVQPSSVIVILSGLALGGAGGFSVGVLTALISNIFLGLGPWLPWQAALWGIMGLTARPLFKNKNRAIRAAIAGAWGFVFGWVMNLYQFLSGFMPFSREAFFLSCALSFTFDAAHALTNAVLFLVISEKQFIRIMKTLKLK